LFLFFSKHHAFVLSAASSLEQVTWHRKLLVLGRCKAQNNQQRACPKQPTKGITKHMPGNGMQVLEKDPGNVKALFRRAQAYMLTQDYIEAKQDLDLALRAEPTNRCACHSLYTLQSGVCGASCDSSDILA